ncbi:MAG: hypothetical protein AAF387_02315 [Pseudomonadota bacterium]
MLAACVTQAQIDAIKHCAEINDTYEVSIDIDEKCLRAPGLPPYPFDLDGLRAEMLLKGLDPIQATLTREAEIAAFEISDRVKRPWVNLPTSSSN